MAGEEREEGKIKRMTEFRTLLEKRIQETQTELEGLRALLEFIDAALLERGFKRAEIIKPTLPAEAIPPPKPLEVAPPPLVEYERAVPLKTVTGELLANLYIGLDSMRIVLAEDKEFNINTPPFMAFLVDRVLAKMQEKDREAARTGEITPDKILSYNIVREGDILREITIRNIMPDRSRELKSTIRWTLEKMHEKTTREG
ncbi:MAG: hypothetical protein AOA65_0413 [Candidatus Bathyarchaeota archaeon BA1]|nr:MAG: hypothetical protein AOA65_0413 [Candidatus Bathyarchaeota archaeon BA1]